ncbi:hypothetical protein V6N11_040514 [Hibiscus sabdariffa]|uniref:Uncharacterized protein n=1 Tax=Hibiscus sabdariffa TaxID=183260 RepID=A0ABR2RHP6_9ROSI
MNGKVKVDEKGFELAFKEYHNMLHDDDDQHGCRFEFTINTRIPENMKCPDYSRVLGSTSVCSTAMVQIEQGAGLHSWLPLNKGVQWQWGSKSAFLL